MRRKLPALAVETGAKSEDVRSGLSPQTIARAFRDNLAYRQARFPAVATVKGSVLNIDTHGGSG